MESDNIYRQQQDDIYSLQLLQPLLQNDYLPFTTWSIRPFCIAFILNDIIINSRNSILEFGSGVSTILMGRLIKQKKINCKIVSIEHNAVWVEKLKELLAIEGLTDLVDVIHAPLAPCSLALESCLWYDTNILNKSMGGSQYDMVIVDGPPAFMPSIRLSRYPAYPFVKSRLAPKSIVVLDDADRQGEQTILQHWRENYHIKFRIIGGTLAYGSSGELINAEIFKY